MTPSIGRSLKDGMAVANQCWPGIGVFLAAWLGLLLVAAAVVVPGVMITGGVPQELIQRLQRQQEQPVAEDESAEDESAEGESADAMEAVDVGAGADANVVNTAAVDAGDGAAARSSNRAEQRELLRAAGAWFGRVWPVLLLALLILVTGSLWIYGGQIGYVARQMRQPPAPIVEFWTVGRRAAGSLAAATSLSIAAIGGAVLLFGLVVWLLTAVFSRGAGWLGALLAFVLIIASIVTLVWFGVRISLWYLAIVVDRLGVFDALQASLRVTRGRWWNLFALLLIMGVVSGVSGMLFDALGALARNFGGPMRGVGGVMIGIPSVVVSLYLGFWTLASLLRFYEDAKTAAPSSGVLPTSGPA